MAKPRLTVAQILAWADGHQARTGAWPTQRSGLVTDAPGEWWSGLHSALLQGRRSLPGGDTLFQLLARERGVADRRGCRPLFAALARRREAVLLHGQGLSRKEIGARLGVTPQAVGQMLRRARQEG
jgi:hypothetical protein